tara:strand:+ start:253 stop:453 length:201 start_codon:yes stop_codon:yes gene_type:complete
MAIDKLTEEIHRIMADGKRSRIHGWTMRNIVAKITASFGEEARIKAKKYIIKLCGYGPTSKETKDV